MENYILEGKKAVPCSNIMVWGKWFETANRHVANNHIGSKRVSTVFLGINHQWGSGPPLLFETMVFEDGGDYSGEYQWRYSTWEEAERCHNIICISIAHGLDLNEIDLSAPGNFEGDSDALCELVIL